MPDHLGLAAAVSAMSKLEPINGQCRNCLQPSNATLDASGMKLLDFQRLGNDVALSECCRPASSRRCQSFTALCKA